MREKEEVTTRKIPRSSSAAQGPGWRRGCRMWDRVVYAECCPGPKVYRTTRGLATEKERRFGKACRRTECLRQVIKCSIHSGCQPGPIRHSEAQRLFRWQQQGRRRRWTGRFSTQIAVRDVPGKSWFVLCLRTDVAGWACSRSGHYIHMCEYLTFGFAQGSDGNRVDVSRIDSSRRSSCMKVSGNLQISHKSSKLPPSQKKETFVSPHRCWHMLFFFFFSFFSYLLEVLLQLDHGPDPSWVSEARKRVKAFHFSVSAFSKRGRNRDQSSANH